VIDIIMKKKDVMCAVDFLKDCLCKIANKQCPIEKLIITKSLRGYYKNPQSIAHKVLADRIGVRDPGNKPGAGDRIPYVYIVTKPLADKKTKELQGNKIETPTYIIENNLKIDYTHYITNQIMKPVSQLFALALERIWELQNKTIKIKKHHEEIKSHVSTLTEKHKDNPDLMKEKINKKIEQIKCKEIKTLLFDPYLRETTNLKNGNVSINNYFKY